MNVVLWILTIALAVHTLMGAVWKFSNGPESVPSLASISKGEWRTLAVLEILATACLIIPAFLDGTKGLISGGAGFVALEMLYFVVTDSKSGVSSRDQKRYWSVIGVVALLLALARNFF